MTTLVWLRRDLRLRDHPALAEAARHDDVVLLFVLDPRLWERAGGARRAWLAATLRALDERTGGRLEVRTGEPREVVPARVGPFRSGVRRRWRGLSRSRRFRPARSAAGHTEGLT